MIFFPLVMLANLWQLPGERGTWWVAFFSAICLDLLLALLKSWRCLNKRSWNDPEKAPKADKLQPMGLENVSASSSLQAHLPQNVETDL